MKILGYVNPETNVGKASPHYPVKHSGVCLIVGTAPCWDEDLCNAQLKFGDADIMAVNEAVRLVEADHIATSHDGRIPLFISQHTARWGGNKPPDAHFRSPQLVHLRPDAYAWDVTVGAGSAPFAATIAILMGYSAAIFVGCPMNGGGGYAPEIAKNTHKSTMDDPRFGDIDKNHQLAQSWKIALKRMPERIPDICSRWRSMSGYTKQIFGGLECPL